ncbi:MAG TPA: MraY family glycosyltransferase [Thermoanaerobaculia bacterium]|jgi:UDP-GlcNAc:undecaprenyl-phosphate GlcNAc-1-phosphate transferase
MTQSLVPLLLLFLSSAVTAFIVTGIVKRSSEHIGFVDVPNERKHHTGATSRLGGIAIIFGFGFPLLMLAAEDNGAALMSSNVKALFGLLAAGSLIVGLGVYDDILGANAPKKFAVQIAAALILVLFGFQFNLVSIAGQVFHLGFFGAVASIIWIVGVINAVNFIDGMDSLATVVALTTAVAFCVIAVIRGDMFSLVVMIALAGSLAGFYPWNRPPAKIFMGDTGSMFIGLLLAAASIAQPTKSPTALIIGGPIVALALPVIDTLIVMKQRFGTTNGDGLSTRVSRVFSADRRHIHHILIARYGSAGKAVFGIWIVTLLFATAAVLTVVQQTKWFGYTAGGLAFLVLLLLRYWRRGVPVAGNA